MRKIIEIEQHLLFFIDFLHVPKYRVRPIIYSFFISSALYSSQCKLFSREISVVFLIYPLTNKTVCECYFLFRSSHFVFLVKGLLLVMLIG